MKFQEKLMLYLQTLRMTNKANISVGKIIKIFVGLIMVTMLFSSIPTLVVTAATGVHNLSDSFEGNAAIFGTDAAAFGGTLDSLTGWFWVLGPMILVIITVLGLFLGKKFMGGGYSRRRR